MSRRRAKKVAGGILLAMLGLESLARAGSPPPLRFDPFRDRPEKVASRAGAARGKQETFEPVLLSTIVGGESPVANLGGEILGLGEEAHGYRLLEVRSFEATFEKNGEVVRLEVLVGQGGER